MSLADIKDAVEMLSPGELAELASFVRERENATWDRQIDADFADDGRLRPILDEVREDIPVGRLQDLPWEARRIGVFGVDATVAYIRNQTAHHRTRSFREEYIAMLNKHGFTYEESMLAWGILSSLRGLDLLWICLPSVKTLGYLRLRENASGVTRFALFASEIVPNCSRHSCLYRVL